MSRAWWPKAHRRQLQALFGLLDGRWQTFPLSVADQGLIGIGNLVMALVLARALGPAAFGSFIAMYAVLALIGGLQGAIVTEPVSVFGARAAGRAADRYATRSLRLLGYIGLAGTLVLAALSLLGYLAEWAHWQLLAAGSCYLLVQRLQWLGRKLCYLRGRLGRSIVASCAYVLAGLATVFGFVASGVEHAAVGFAAMGAGSLAAGVVGLRGVSLLASPGLRRDLVVLRRHWRYGRWLLLSSAGAWVTNWAPFPLLAATWGPPAAAGLRVAQTLMMPAMQLAGAVSAVVLPVLSRRWHRAERIGELARNIALLLGLLTGAYALLVAGFAEPLLTVAFGHDYAAHAGLVAWLGVAAVFEALKGASGMVLMVTEQTRALFVARVVGVATMALVGLPLILLQGALGAAIALAAIAGSVWLAQVRSVSRLPAVPLAGLASVR